MQAQTIHETKHAVWILMPPAPAEGRNHYVLTKTNRQASAYVSWWWANDSFGGWMFAERVGRISMRLPNAVIDKAARYIPSPCKAA